MKLKIKELSKKPWSGAVYFMVILLILHFFWKFTVLGDESDLAVSFFGIDITAPFNVMSGHIAAVVHWFLNLIGYQLNYQPCNILRFENGNAVRIVWACSGIKQAYIFFSLIALYHGPVGRKLWYIPLGIFVVYLFNLIRITAITAIVHSHPQWFDLVHEHLFKYLFYALIFGMWVLWDEKLSKTKQA